MNATCLSCEVTSGRKPTLGRGLPLWAHHMGDSILAANRTRRTDLALFMVRALTDPAMVREVPTIVGAAGAPGIVSAAGPPDLRVFEVCRSKATSGKARHTCDDPASRRSFGLARPVGMT